MKITSVERNPKNKDRMMVYVDEAYCFTVCEDDYLSLGLYEKKDLTTDEIEHIKKTVCLREAKSTAVSFLAMKVRCEAEVRTKLIQHTFDEFVVESVIEELTSIGYINDRMYVQKFLNDRSKLKPKSKKMLKYELLAKGVDADIIDEAINNWQVDDLDVAEALVKKKFAKYDIEDEKVIKKIYSFLHHRGFGFDVIESIVSSMKDQRE